VIPLADGAGTYTEEITVTADPFRGGANGAVPSVQTMTSAELRGLSGVLADDPLRAVQTLPGVATANDLRSEFSVRGSDFRRMGLAIDGLPTPWLVHNVRNYENNGSIALINGDLVSSAALSAGAQPQDHPERLGAWLDFGIREGSRDADEWRIAVSVSAASLVADGPIGDAHRGSWLVSARQSYVQWIARRVAGSGTAFGFTDAQTKFVYDVTPRQQLQAGVVAGRSTLEQDAGRDPPPSTLGTGSTATGVGWVAWRSTVGSNVVLTNRVGIVGGTFENDHPSGAVLASGSLSGVTYAANAAWTLRPSLVVRGGLLVDRQQQTSASSVFLVSPTGALAGRRVEQTDGSATTTGVDARIAWTGSNARAFETGVRVARWSLTSETTTSPWLLGSLPLGGSLVLRAGVSAAHQRPDLDQVIGTFGSASAKPERALSSDTSIEGRVTRDIRWQATVYDRREHDVLRLENSEARLAGTALALPSTLTPAWSNALDGHAYGIEVLVQRRAASGLSGWASYAFGHTRYTDAGRGESYWGDFDQRHIVNVFAEQRLSPKTSVSLKLRAGSGLPIPGYFQDTGDGLAVGAERNTVRLPTYSRLDLRGNHAFNYRRSRLTLFAEVVNVLNRTNYSTHYGTVLADGTAASFTATQFPILPSVGILIEF